MVLRWRSIGGTGARSSRTFFFRSLVVRFGRTFFALRRVGTLRIFVSEVYYGGNVVVSGDKRFYVVL